MAAFGGVFLLLGIGAMFLVQVLTLVTAQLLPKHWPVIVPRGAAKPAPLRRP